MNDPVLVFDGPFRKKNTQSRYGGVVFLYASPDAFVAQITDRKRLLARKSVPLGALECVPRDQLLTNITTDHIIRVAHLLTDDEELLGDRVLCGLSEEYQITEHAIRSFHCSVLVAGSAFGRGSSREQAVIALQRAGIRAILATSFGPIFEQNAINNGLLTSTNTDLAYHIQQGQEISLNEFLIGKNPLQRDIVKAGGLFPFVKTQGKKHTYRKTKRFPMNIYEQRIARAINAASVTTGDTCVLPVDQAYSYVGLSGLARSALKKAYGTVHVTLQPDLFEDHFALSDKNEVSILTQNQRNFAKELGLTENKYHFGRLHEGGGLGISHRVMLERINPRRIHVAIATDSHTPTLGALPILAIPVGSLYFAVGIGEGSIPYIVHPVMRISLGGSLPFGISIRDAQLEMAATILPPKGTSIVEFGGTGLNTLTFSQVAALCNMVPEVFMGADIAVTERYSAGIDYLFSTHGIPEEEADSLYGIPDNGCTYSVSHSYDLGKSSPWIALPGSPNSGKPLKALTDHPIIHRAYIVSCTNGLEDLMEAAAVLHGNTVAKDTRFIIIPSSKKVCDEAQRLGILTILANAGATIRKEIACSACIGDGPDALHEGEVAISATNRNFYGRMGAKSAQVYLAGAYLTTVAAMLGRIPGHGEYMSCIQKMNTKILTTHSIEESAASTSPISGPSRRTDKFSA